MYVLALTLCSSPAALHAGAKAAHILVYDRAEQRVIEETISPYMVLGMRNMYQTPVGRMMLRSGAHKALLELTQREGRYMNSPASAKVNLIAFTCAG